MKVLLQRIGLGKSIFPVAGKSLIPMISAFMAAKIIFGKYDAVNLQLALYIFSRVVFALAGILKQRYLPSVELNFSWFSASVWGAVLTLFEVNGQWLLPSLRSSMDYIYRESGII